MSVHSFVAFWNMKSSKHNEILSPAQDDAKNEGRTKIIRHIGPDFLMIIIGMCPRNLVWVGSCSPLYNPESGFSHCAVDVPHCAE